MKQSPKLIRNIATREISSLIRTLIVERRQLELMSNEILNGGWDDNVKEEFSVKALEAHNIVEDLLLEFDIPISPAYTYTHKKI